MSVVKVLAILGSPHINGSTDKMLTAYCDGLAKAAEGNKDVKVEINKVVLSQKRFSPCKYCAACHKSCGPCVQKDDVTDLLNEVVKSDIVVHAVPVWFYGVPGFVKGYIDRWTSLCVESWEDYRVDIADKMNGKVMAAIAVCGDPEYKDMCFSAIDTFKKVAAYRADRVKWAGGVSTCCDIVDTSLESCAKLGDDSLALFLKK